MFSSIDKLVCSYAQIIFTAGFAGQGLLNKDPKVWLDGTRPPQKYVCKCIKSVHLVKSDSLQSSVSNSRLCLQVNKKACI